MPGRYSQSGTWLTDREHVPNGSWTLRPSISRRKRWRPSDPYYRLVNPIGLAIVALVVGIGIGVLLAWATLRTRQAEPSPTFDVVEPVVPVGMAEVLAVLPSAGVVVGPHDEVLEATAMARTLGLVRGSRISMPELLQLVRAVRRDGDARTVELQISRGVRVAATYLTARVAPLDESLILVLADDQTAARRIDETRRDFVANISHELKTPIGAIALLAEAVEEAADDSAAVRKFASRMGIESARLTDLVSQIIQLSRLQSDSPLVDPEIVDIDEVLAEAVDRRRMDAERNRITLAVAGTSGARVLGSARQLEIAVGNLVENAIAYSDPGARVVVAAHVQAKSDDDYVEITVSDNGIGIPAAEVDRIFERFYRVDYARSRANGGTGLGLAIVKHIAAIHGGEVAVWSQVGQGSTFTIKIPAHLHEVSSPVPESAASSHAEQPPDQPTYEPQEINQ
jgi:two-component system, OmpR family, sensor histidine kinase SenX3